MDKNTIGGALTAVIASLCCIVPLLALFAGVGGFASVFSWIGPIRPYLITFTVVLLSIAWYKKLKTIDPSDCSCENSKKGSFLQSKLFLILVSIFAILMISYPYYAIAFLE
ncbi:MAG: hypothetical protein HRT43_15025 [Campylobacteraceae bacterium]|nr:hypothetical protein [Campylobacteraceae bacterium]